MNTAKLWIIIPCYNEQEVLPITAPLFLERLTRLIDAKKITPDSRILFINDGSSDATWDIIRNLSSNDPHYQGICLSRNRGHQNAVLAGLMEAKDHCDITVSVDCDGQDDIGAIEQMVENYYSGSEVVYGVRSSRETDNWFKRVSAQSFYKLLRDWGDADIVYNHADYRLISSRALQSLAEFREVNLFLRGLVPLVGFKSSVVYYVRKKRIAGESHYPLRKMLLLAVDGITSLSIKPIRVISAIGILISLFGMLGVIWAIVQALTGFVVQGWASTICVIFFIGGLQLISLGVIGEYIGKTYLESKHRPRFIISERTWEEGTP